MSLTTIYTTGRNIQNLTTNEVSGATYDIITRMGKNGTFVGQDAGS